MSISRRRFLALGAALGAGAAAAPAAAAEAPALAALADLLALDPARLPDGALRRVLGHGRPNDGGGGLFLWQAASRAPPDSGTVFAPDAAAAGRWLRLVEGDWRAEWFGVRADGAGDDGPALARAIDAAAGRVLLLPKGVIRVATPLAIAAPCYHLRGQQPERGQYGRNNGTVIDAAALPRGAWLVERFDLAPPLTDTIGPFVHENLDIRLGAAHGFAFGRADLDGAGTERAAYDPVKDREGQKYVHGVRFVGCRITGAIARHASDADGRIARSGQRLIRLTKCFESAIENCVLVGGDVQVETWGCDAPLIRDVRSNNSHLPVLFQRSGWFAVSHRISDFQCESFTFGAVVSDGVMLEARDLRIEPNIAGDPAGMGRFDLTAALGITAQVTAGEARLRFSRDMTDVLFPGLSLIELSDGEGHADACLAAAVEGETVAVWSEGFVFTWSAAAARVARVHGYGLLHGGAHDATVTGGHPDPFRDCPTFVYRGEAGSMFVTGVGKVPGSNRDVRSLALGNLYRKAPAQLRQMAFAACSPWIVADPAHPYVDGPTPRPIAARDAGGRRVWSPRSHAAIGVPFRIVAGPAAGPERIAAWLLRPGSILALPAAPGPSRLGLLARAADGAARLRWEAGGAAEEADLDAAWRELRRESAGGDLRIAAAGTASVLVAQVAAERP